MREKLSVNEKEFQYLEKTKDLVDQLMDIAINYRQSGHPGGSRSKVQMFLALLLGGAMRWDIRDPESPFGDRFVLVGGHTVPLVYTTLAVLNEALLIHYGNTGDERFKDPHTRDEILYIDDLIGFRSRDGLSGHAEMANKTLFLKYNTGPSGHGAPAAAGEAFVLKYAGLPDVRVFALDGEGGLTPGAVHETLNSSYGLGLSNFVYIVDWNDYGIDNFKHSSVVYGTPNEWFGSHGWKVWGAEDGADWTQVMAAYDKLVDRTNPGSAPSAIWFKTNKGRGYGKFGNASHGAPHKLNSPEFWKTKQEFTEKYGVRFVGQDEEFVGDAATMKKQFADNLEVVKSVLKNDPELVAFLANRLVELGDAVQNHPKNVNFIREKNPFHDERLYDFENYPDSVYVAPGEKAPNRTGLSNWGAWINAFGRKEYNRPLVLAASADLAESTGLAGFGKAFDGTDGYGLYERDNRKEGVILPQEITEFTNSAIMTGISSVNFSDKPYDDFEGFWGATSTYGSFSYLKYGPFRLYSQLVQDCPLKMGKVIWIAGHSGPETADDSRTHFGIFSPGVTQLFPSGHIINLHPWEVNEVPVLLGAALSKDEPIIALHLTRPAIEVPDREKLGMPSHTFAAKGAYVVRDYKPDLPKQGAVIVQGTSAMDAIIKLLPELDESSLNVKIVCVTSAELYKKQDAAYQNSVLDDFDKLNSMVVTTQAKILMNDWIFLKENEKYAVSSDWDNRWRTGGRLEEVLDEAHLTPTWILKSIQKFAEDQETRERK